MPTYVLRNGDLVLKEHAEPRARVHVVRDIPDYKSPLGTGVVSGRAARREELKRSNSREVDPSEWKGGFRNADFCRRHGIAQTGDPLPKGGRLSTWIDRD